MTNRNRKLPTLSEWRQASIRAIEKLPPKTLKRLNEDRQSKNQFAEQVATLAFYGFKLWDGVDRSGIEYDLEKLEAAQKNFDWVINRLKADAQFVARNFPVIKKHGGAEDGKYRFNRLLFAIETIGELAAKDAGEMDSLKARLKEIRKNHDATMGKHVEMLIMQYSIVTKIHPTELKLSASYGPRTYLMNFIIEMVDPVPGYGKDENDNLPRRIHDNFWSKLKPIYMQLRARPGIFEN